MITFSLVDVESFPVAKLSSLYLFNQVFVNFVVLHTCQLMIIWLNTSNWKEFHFQQPSEWPGSFSFLQDTYAELKNVTVNTFKGNCSILYILFLMSCTGVVSQRLEWYGGNSWKCEHVNLVLQSWWPYIGQGHWEQCMDIKKFPEPKFAIEPYLITMSWELR